MWSQKHNCRFLKNIILFGIEALFRIDSTASFSFFAFWATWSFEQNRQTLAIFYASIAAQNLLSSVYVINNKNKEDCDLVDLDYLLIFTKQPFDHWWNIVAIFEPKP